jgi:hypothetical protein
MITMENLLSHNLMRRVMSTHVLLAGGSVLQAVCWMEGPICLELNGNMCGGIFRCGNISEMEGSKSGRRLGRKRPSKLWWSELEYSGETVDWDFEWFDSQYCGEGFRTLDLFSSSKLVEIEK